MTHKPLLIEIGTEEIPAGVAPALAEALKTSVLRLLTDADVHLADMHLGVTPRRLLLHAPSCPLQQPDRKDIIWGPPEHVAFAKGKPTAAAAGFARKLGLSVDDFVLEAKNHGATRYLKAEIQRRGRPIVDILAEAMPDILRRLPCPKQMRWQDGAHRDDAFIRPIRWIVALLGEQRIPFSYAGVSSGEISCGHRMHRDKSGRIDVHDPFAWLEEHQVIADWQRRRRSIADQLEQAAAEAKVALHADEDLLSEVTDLTEWPHVVTGRFDQAFLRLPEKVARIELKQHQRCFVSTQPDGSPSNVFFAVANIRSRQPEIVARGNERVVNARLADAAFYYERDPQISLEDRVEKLSEVVFQDGLGMVGDQVRRLRGFVLDNAPILGVDANLAQRAAYLCKSDLTTGLVSEFPELQGYMGGIYARLDGEPEPVCQAIAEHYQPESAEDPLPESAIARAIGIAERADKLLGYFHIGRIPTASADPFGLRRAAIGLIRLLEGEGRPVPMTLSEVLDEAAKQWNQQRVTVSITAETKTSVHRFVCDRLLGMAEHFSISRQALEAALAAHSERPLAMTIEVARLLVRFAHSETGEAVATANKRIANILKKAEEQPSEVDPSLFTEEAEKHLFEALKIVEEDFPETPTLQLDMLATLREPVDRFFDDVMVMTEDAALRANRLALLTRLRELFLRLADVSRLF